MGSKLLSIAGMLVAPTMAKPILVHVMYEADCPFSKAFAANEFGPMDLGGCVKPYVDFDWIAFGNAGGSAGAWTCQHGEDECYGNKVLNCAKAKIGAISENTDKFVTCFMTKLNIPGKLSREPGLWQSCIDEMRGQNVILSPSVTADIDQCVEGPEGDALMTQAQQMKTDKMLSAPWAYLDYDPSQYNLQNALFTDICNELPSKGIQQPQCCLDAIAAGPITSRRLLV